MGQPVEPNVVTITAALRRRRVLHQLRQIADGHAPRPATLDLTGVSLSEADLSDMDLSDYDLSGADLRAANLQGARLSRTRLCGAVLHKARLGGAELRWADLTGADLTDARAAGASFADANLTDAVLCSAGLEFAVFDGATLRGADFRMAAAEDATFDQADVTEADFSCAHLSRAEFHGSELQGTRFRYAILREARFAAVEGYRDADWVGADLRGTDFVGAYMARQFAHEQNFLWEFRAAGGLNRAVYWVWWATSDCGRSLGRWLGCAVAVATVFAFAYALLPVDFGAAPTPLSPLYASVLTLTGFGRVPVVPLSMAAQVVVVAEVLLGYVLAGGLVSIFLSRMTQRDVA